jgi:hypothetical protein
MFISLMRRRGRLERKNRMGEELGRIVWERNIDSKRID